MANRTVVIQGTNVGLDINRIAIYRDEIGDNNLVSVVSKAAFMNGYEFEDDDAQENYVCQCDDPCKTVINLSLRQKNYPPTVSISGSTSALVGSSVLLTATATDPNGDALTYEWNDGTTTETNTVTSNTFGDETYSVVATDIIGDWGNDTHTINWFTTTTTTTTTTQPPGTTTTTTTSCTDCAGDIDPISDFSAAVGGTTGTITLSGTNVTNFRATSFDTSLVTESVSGNTLTWTTNNSDNCGTVRIRVFADNTAGGNCCTEAEDFFITVTGCVGTTTTTTTTTAAPTTTTTTAAPTTTTTTAFPGVWNLALCSGGTANQQILYDANLSVGQVILASNGICYEIDSYSATGVATQTVSQEYGSGECALCESENP